MKPRLLLGVTHPMTARVLLRGQPQALRDAGFDVGLVTGSDPDGSDLDQQQGIALFRVPMVRRPNPPVDLRALVDLYRVLRRFRPDVVNFGTPKAGFLGCIAAAAAAVPRRVYTVRGLPVETCRGSRRLLLKQSEKLAARAAHKVVCVSESVKRRMLDLGLVEEGRVLVLGPGSSNGVDTSRFRPAERTEKVAARHALGICPDVPVIGFVGRLTQDKGIADLAQIYLGDIRARFPDAKLLLVGEFESGDAVPSTVRQRLGADSGVHILGFVSDPERAYSAMDVLAFPSFREGFPNAPLEAAASAIPVAGYACTGTVDAVEDGTTGTLVEAGNQTDLASAVIRYLENSGLRKRHGESGRERVVRDFRQELVWQRWVQFYRELLASRPVAGSTVPDP